MVTQQNLAETQRQTIPMEGAPTAESTFEVLCITAGEGNGWYFTAEVLQASLPLWEGLQCFIDHVSIENPMDGHSVRDLAGLITKPVWDEGSQGIKATLTKFGPGGELLAQLAQEIIKTDGMNTKVGLSADLEFLNEGSQVKEIIKVYSCDLVIDPARGGAILRALNSVQNRRKILQMNNQMQNDKAGVRALMDQNAALNEMSQQAAQARALRAEMCRQVLDSTLSTCELPVPIKDRVRKDFSNRVFEPSELNAAIEDGRNLASALLAGSSVRGFSGGRFSGMYSSQDQLNAAVHDMLGAKRPEGLEKVSTARLSGIRELYCMMTGDLDFHGGYDSQRAQFAASSDLPGILKNALNKLIAQRWDELGASGYRWWEPIVTIEHMNNLQDVTGILVGELSTLPTVNEGAAYGSLSVADSPEVGSWIKKGAYVGLTIEMFEKDDTMKLRQYPFKLATSGLRTISKIIADIFTANSGVGPTMADTKALFHVDHANLGTTAFSAAEWEAANAAIYNQSMLVAAGGTAPKLAVDGRYCIVPRALRLAAQKVLYPSLAYEANITSENMQRGQFGDVITCPEFTDATDWAVVADPVVAPSIYLCERFGILPEIYIADNQITGALFTNDEVRIKARQFVNVIVSDHRPLYKENVV